MQLQFSLTKEQLLKPLQNVCSVLTARPSIAILTNVLLQLKELSLIITGTDLEVELSAQTDIIESTGEGEFTLPARKLLEICKSFSDESLIQITVKDSRATISAERSRFNLSILPASEYPILADWEANIEFSLPQTTLRRLIEATQFAMANQDARYFLNGLKLETEKNLLRTVATDGHRLAVCSIPFNQEFDECSIIIPRKAVNDIKNLLAFSEQTATVQIGKNNLLLDVNNVIFTTKLIEGNFPDHRRVMPINANFIMEAEWNKLRQAFIRAAILTNDRYRGVSLNLIENQLKIAVHNPEQEEAEEIIDVNYQGEPMEVGFNIKYLLDALDVMKCARVRFRLVAAGAGCIIEDCDDPCVEYVVMPMRL